MRYLAIDLGEKRTGVALGDALTRLASPLETLEIGLGAGGGEELLAALARVVAAQLGERPGDKGELVFGLPLNMDGTEGPQAKKVRAFAAKLAERTGRAAHFQDERLTSVAADWTMSRSGMTRKQKKEKRDALAAAHILRDFLEALPGAQSRTEDDRA